MGAIANLAKTQQKLTTCANCSTCAQNAKIHRKSFCASGLVSPAAMFSQNQPAAKSMQ
jgi:hypothetical protein